MANEIKELAKQTAEATGEIKSRIEGIQGSTHGTVKQIEQISKVIHEVNDIVSKLIDLYEINILALKDLHPSRSSMVLNRMVDEIRSVAEAAGNVVRSKTVTNQVIVCG